MKTINLKLKPFIRDVNVALQIRINEDDEETLFLEHHQVIQLRDQLLTLFPPKG